MSEDHDNMNPEDENTRTHIVLNKGTEAGHYRIIQKIGAVGMGEVYLAEESELQRFHAIMTERDNRILAVMKKSERSS